MNLKKITKDAQRECNRFNARYAIGTKGVVTKDDDSKIDTCVKHPAQVMGSSAVVFLEGISGAYLLERFAPNQEKINVVPAKDTNSLRDKVKDGLREYLEKELSIELTGLDLNETSAEMADTIFEALQISEDDQDIEGAKVVVNPKVRAYIMGGVATLEEYTEGIDLEFKDYDTEGCENFNNLKKDEAGKEYYLIR